VGTDLSPFRPARIGPHWIRRLEVADGRGARIFTDGGWIHVPEAQIAYSVSSE